MISQQQLTQEQQQLVDSFVTEAEICEYLARCGDYNTEDHILTGDLDVLQAVSQRQEYELKLLAEEDPQVRDYLAQCEEEEGQ
jgi:uncharacterized membrane-anchored protein YhcB (DUF1043 family)